VDQEDLLDFELLNLRFFVLSALGFVDTLPIDSSLPSASLVSSPHSRFLHDQQLGVCGIDFKSSVRFGTECQKILRNRFGIGSVWNFTNSVERFGIKISLHQLGNKLMWWMDDGSVKSM